ncbi:MAG: AAA family ATPase [Myxococcales bacterium]|nr:AAA family ATPase [Myxococcales bacterium]
MLEVIRRNFCRHVTVLPEAASILFSGGFPRESSDAGLRATQRAIFHTQHQLEEIARSCSGAAVALCDRGTLDGLAYWPGEEGDLWEEVGSSRGRELARYDAVIHLRTPGADQGYDHSNPVRVESASEAAGIDRRILGAWEGHPRRYEVPSADDFLEKVRVAVERIRELVPACCRGHRVPELDP